MSVPPLGRINDTMRVHTLMLDTDMVAAEERRLEAKKQDTKAKQVKQEKTVEAPTPAN